MSILNIIEAALRAIVLFFDKRQHDADKQAGRDAAENEAKGELLDRIKASNDIDDSDLPDSLLNHPDDR